MATTPYLPTEQAVAQSAPEAIGIQRQRKLADLLTAQAFNQPQGQMISGHYVAPSWTQQLNPLANALAGEAISNRADKQQQELAVALRAKQAGEIEKFGELESQDKAAALRYALSTDNPVLRNIAQEELKGIKLGKGEVFTRTSLGGGVTKMEGNPDLPESLQYAISVGQLPANPATWNPQQAAMARSIVESKARAGASQTPIIVGNKSIAEQIGPMMRDDQVKTLGAVKMEDAANNIIRSVDTNKIFAGPMANVRLGAAQLASNLGMAGDTTEQKIANTRQTIQGLAQLTLQGRKEMKGEGAIQVQEGQLAERAMSGDINFTPAEIKMLAGSAKRYAKYQYDQYNNKLQYMAQNPDTAGLVPYYTVPKLEEPVANDQWTIKRK